MDNIENAQESGTPRAVAAERGVGWISDAWPLFTAQWKLWVLLSVIALGVSLVCGMAPLIGSLLTPFVSTLLAAGMMLVARKQRDGGVPEVGDLFTILSHPALPRLMIVTLIYVGLSLGAMLIVGIVFGMGGVLGVLAGAAGGGDSAAALAGAGSMVLLGVLVMLAIMIPILALYWYAIPLVLFRDMQPWPAMTTSLAGVLRNLVPLLVYGVVCMLIVIVALIPLMLGMLAAMPLITISWLISYEDIFS